MPRTSEQTGEDHYDLAHRAHTQAVESFEPGDREYTDLMLEGLLHAVLDLGVGLAELAAQLGQLGQAAAAEQGGR